MDSHTITRIKTKMPSPYQLTATNQDTHDTKTFCFALPDDATLDMLPGDHLYVHATINGKAVKRPYTPPAISISRSNGTRMERFHGTCMIGRSATACS
jgi:ferredoxin-NADP reductase